MSETSEEKTRGRAALGCFLIVALAALLAIGGIVTYDLLTGGERDQPGEQQDGGLAAAVAELSVADEHTAGYDRELFGDYDRERVIERSHRRFPACRGFYSRYDDQCHRSPDAVHADHTVALGEAWHSGAWEWNEEQRDTFAADPDNLALMTAGLNIGKSDDDPTEWLPEQRLCAYVETWVEVKTKYGLSVDSAERDALVDAAEDC